MLGRLLKLVAYRKAPVGTFALLHPRLALRWALVLLLARRLFSRREGRTG